MKKQTAKQNRRYKLHQKIKSIFRYSAGRKTVFVNPEVIGGLESKQKVALNELREKFGYNIQTEIR